MIFTGNGVTNRNSYIALSLYAVSLGLAVGWAFISRMAGGPMKQLIEISSEMGSNEGDLSRDFPVSGTDGFRELSESYNLFLRKLRAIIGNVRKMGVNIAVESVNVAQRIKASTENTLKQKELSDIIFNYSDEATVAIGEISQNVQFISDSTDKNLKDSPGFTYRIKGCYRKNKQRGTKTG